MLSPLRYVERISVRVPTSFSPHLTIKGGTVFPVGVFLLREMSKNGAAGASFLRFEIKELVGDGGMSEEYESSCGDVAELLDAFERLRSAW